MAIRATPAATSDTFLLIRVIAGQAPPPSAFSIALSVFVPWGDTNKPIDLKLMVEDDDGNKLIDMTTQMVVGRSPMLKPGSGQHAALAINAVQVFPKAGGYRVVVKFGGDTRTWPFRVNRPRSPKEPS